MRVPRNVWQFKQLCTLTLVLTLWQGCSDRGRPSGRVNIRTAALTLPRSVSRVTATADPAGISVDLSPTGEDNVYGGNLELPAGAQFLTISAFSGENKVGEGTADITVIEAQATSVAVRVLDLTGPGPTPGIRPQVTFIAGPRTATTGESITLSANAVDPDRNPLSYAWTSNCESGTFASPDQRTTTWSTTVASNCTITATVSDGQAEDSLSLVVNVSGASSSGAEGGASVTATYVAHPRITSVGLLEGYLLLPACEISRWDPDATCSPELEFGKAYTVGVSVDLDGSLSGLPAHSSALTLSDNCEGTFVELNGTFWRWLAPRSAFGRVCTLTARYTSEDGLVDEFAIGARFVDNASGCFDDIYEDGASSNRYATIPVRVGTAEPVVLSPLFSNDVDLFNISLEESGTLTISAGGPEGAQRELSLWMDLGIEDYLLASGTGSVTALTGSGIILRVEGGHSGDGVDCDTAGYDLSFTLTPQP